jgi:hypothetical protein
MQQHGFRHLLVIDGEHEIGILSIRDLITGILSSIGATQGSG